MDDVASAERFLRDYRADYEELLATVRGACSSVRKSHPHAGIDDVYTRGASQGGTEFKDPRKIANKARQKGSSATDIGFLGLTDIIGLTVVVQYPDQVEQSVEAVRSALLASSVTTDEPQKHENKSGYYATHLVCSKRLGGNKIQCEIQFKTMLHDAWSAKMHDLTYKPFGLLDPRLGSLMASIATTIENLEQQSRLIRDMIQSGWNVEDETRQAARKYLFESMLRYGDKIRAVEGDSAIVELHDRIEALMPDLAGRSLEDREVTSVIDEVEQLCADESKRRHGWLMAGRLASERPSQDLTRFLCRHVDGWLAISPRMLAAEQIGPEDILAVPLMLYVIGDLDRAIGYSERILADQNLSHLPAADRVRIDFNRITFMIEREYHSPTTDGDAKASLRSEVYRVMDSEALNAIEGWTSAILDTRGLATITFATTKEEVRDGIENCIRSLDKAPDGEVKVAEAYTDLNLRLGWRRYFEIELRTQTSPRMGPSPVRPHRGSPAA